MNESVPILTDQQVRDLRDRAFECRSTDSNWFACRENWMRPDSIRWLLERKPL